VFRVIKQFYDIRPFFAGKQERSMIVAITTPTSATSASQDIL
jgi:hypothetical protein